MNIPALHTCATPVQPAARAHTVDIIRRRPFFLTDIRNLALHVMGLLLLLGLTLHASPLRATVMAGFDGGADTPITLEQFGSSPGPSIEATGGNPGGFLQLTDSVNSQNNFATFDRTDAGTFSTSSFSFDFRIIEGDVGGADGFSFSYGDTTTYGTTGGLGSAPFVPEDPKATGILGFGFDTWWNGFDDGPTSPSGGSADFSEVSVFWNNALVARIDDTRLLTPALTLDDGLWHTVTGLVNFDAATVSLSVDGNALFTALAVPGLAPFESRILFAGRTGGANEEAAVDNVLVEFGEATAVPEPGTLLLLLMGATGILLTQRRCRQYQAF